MRLDTSLACMFCTIACGEDIRGPTSTEDVVERRLCCAGGMAVDGLEGRGTGNRDMVGGEANKGAMLDMQTIHSLRPLVATYNPRNPSRSELCEERSRILSKLKLVDEVGKEEQQCYDTSRQTSQSGQDGREIQRLVKSQHCGAETGEW